MKNAGMKKTRLVILRRSHDIAAHFSPMKKLPLIAAVFVALARTSLAADTAPPSNAFDLRPWKLQVPGPLEIKQLAGYSSPYFFLNKNREMVFHLDAAEKGTTTNAHYVRS